MKFKGLLMVILIPAGLAFLLSISSSATSAPAGATQYQVDAAHTSIVFRISHLGMSYTYGRFNDVSGRFAIDGEDPHNISFELTVKTASIDTNNKKRDNHLRGPDFFNARQFPVITLSNTHAHESPDGFELAGDLTLHGTTKRITVDLKKIGEGKDPWGKQRIGFATEFKIKRSDFGMKEMLEVVGDEVEMMISFEGIRQ